VKWTRAIQHLDALADTCADMATRPATIQPLRVVQLWAVGEVLGGERDMDVVTVALVVDLPVDDVPWLSEPPGAQHWANATRLAKNPVRPLWRSVHAPVWNHRIDRPALLWDVENGRAEATLKALHAGRGDDVRLPKPAPDEIRSRLDDDFDVSLRALRGAVHTYADRRWAPGKLTPLADTLWLVSEGYLDLLDARPGRMNA
jgi:hypothetical protein